MQKRTGYFNVRLCERANLLQLNGQHAPQSSPIKRHNRSIVQKKK